MEKIYINGRLYYYKVVRIFDYSANYTYTKFYKREIYKSKKYCFFGEYIDKIKYKWLFSLVLDVNSVNCDKKEIIEKEKEYYENS